MPASATTATLDRSDLFLAHGAIICSLPDDMRVAVDADETVWIETIATTAPITPEMIEADDTLTDEQKARILDDLFEYAPMDEE